MATCTKNPDAKCVSPMGGCGSDACQPKFYDSLGKQVQCEYEALYCTFIMMKFCEKDMHL